MSRKAENVWMVLAPSLPDKTTANRVFRKHASRLSRVVGTDDGDVFDSALEETLQGLKPKDSTTALRAALYVLTDIARQRWEIRVSRSGNVEVRRPAGESLDPLAEKKRIREQELVKRDEQLRKPATRKFVSDMEKKTPHRGSLVSIYSLIRDGRELADSLRAARDVPRDQRGPALREIVDPYIQFVDEAEHCELTGLRLKDIWRYFRHTWSNQYSSTPGRTMAFLVRDHAREFHPVIGIGALGSPIVQIRERDAWIGWHPEAFMDSVSESPSAELGIWLFQTIQKALDEIYIDDFVEKRLLKPSDVRKPTVQVIEKLTEYGESQRLLHHRLVQRQDLKHSTKSGSKGSEGDHWELRAKTHLFQSKRALSLVEMLKSRAVLLKHLSPEPKIEEVRNLLANAEGRRAVNKVLRKSKADRVGIAMADITVCGAIAPYAPILGGKLVSMLTASPEVIAAYRDKYQAHESEIASSMAGRSIVRPSNLVFLGTTSLYGIGSSQYNRLRMPADRIGGNSDEHLSYLEIGKSDAYGTSHFSSETVDLLVALVQQTSNGQRVNSLFGEGVSPKLRKIRNGLDELKLPTDALLQHGRQRIIYGIPLVRNLREFLLGMDDKPDYIFDMTDPKQGSSEIASWWIERWLTKRIESDDVLTSVEEHTLVRPVRHGARVVLPNIDDGQGDLFDDFTY